MAILAFSLSAIAQTTYIGFTSVKHPQGIDTVTNTGADTVNLGPMTASYNNLTIQPTVTKISGTLTSNSTPQLQGSLDKVKYYNIAGDTLHLTNTTTLQTAWILTQLQYRYYRIIYTGTGTQTSTLAAKAFLVH